MIQPLGSSRTRWILHWLDLEEPVVGENGVFLPTLVVISDSSGIPISPPAIFEELDQVRIENWLVRLFDQAGAPDRVDIRACEDWDEEAWRGFSEEQRVEIRFQKAPSTGPDDLKALALSVSTRLATGPGTPPPELARGLVETFLRINSPVKREALLRKAIQLDPDCAAARIELADAEFQKGNWKACMEAYEETIRRESKRLSDSQPRWWLDRSTRPLLRALYGRSMTLWHRGRYADAAAQLTVLLEKNPADNQGVRFFIPLLHLLAEDPTAAASAFEGYEAAYPDDYPEPAFLFGWGLCRFIEGDESGARAKYREAICRNLYIAPLLLDEPAPTRMIWLPNDRSEPNYASEFLDSYAILWDRESGSLRILREVWEEMRPRLQAIIDLRSRMFDFQDQRYEPRFKALWQELVEAEEKLTTAACRAS